MKTSPGRKSRALWKCDFCRSQKRKCEPFGRTWPGQKCNACEKRGLACGPNVRNRPYSYSKRASLQTSCSSIAGQFGMNPSSKSPKTAEAFIVPFDRDCDFTGRVAELDRLERILCAGEGHNRAALVGLGGTGKTQVAIEFAYRERGKTFSRTFWLSTKSLAQFEKTWSSIGTSIGLKENDTLDDCPSDQVLAFLERDQQGRTLIVIDDIDDVTLSDCSTIGNRSSRQLLRSLDLSKHMPHLPNVSILFISRCRDTAFRLTGHHAANLEIAEMNDPEALELFQKKTSIKSFAMEDCTRVLKLLENLPLAITQAAVYMRTREITLQRYLEHFGRSVADQTMLLSQNMGDLRRINSSTNSVLANLHRTFDLIETKSSLAIEILSNGAFLHHENIPMCLLYSKHGRTDQTLAIDDAIGTLIGFYLVGKQPEGELASISISVTTQISVREWLKSKGRLEQEKSNTLRLIFDNLPDLNHTSWKQYMKLGPHIENILCYEFETVESKRLKTDVQHAFGRFYLSAGAANSGALIALEAERGRMQLLGGDHIETIRSRSLLASILAFQGQVEQAKQMLHDIVFPSHGYSPDSAARLEYRNNLAALHLFQGEFQDAQNLIRTAFSRQLEDPGFRHFREQSGLFQHEMLALEETFATLNRMLRDEEVAKNTYSHINTKRIESLGPHHPFTLISISNLASTAFALYRSIPNSADTLKSAIGTYQSVLAIRERVLGSNHSAALKTRSNLAILKYALSFITNDVCTASESVDTMKAIFATQRETMGESHFLTKVTGVTLLLMCSWQENIMDVKQLLPQLQGSTIGVYGTMDRDIMLIDRCLSSIRCGEVSLNPRQHYTNFAQITSVKTIAVEHPDLIVIEWALAFDIFTG